MKKGKLQRLYCLLAALVLCALGTQAQTTAFSQDFTAVDDSTDPADYGFTLSYGNGSSSSLVNFSVTGGVLQCVAGPYASSSAGNRTGTATATFDAIGSGNSVTVNYKWALGNASGNATGSYTKTRIGSDSGKALELAFYGSDGGKLTVNGTAVQTNTNIRNTTYTVAATLNLSTKKVTALTLTCSNSNYSYTATEPIAFASDIDQVDRFEFENSERQNWANTSSIDDVSIVYEELVVEEVASVAISGPQSMTFGADPNTPYVNAYSVAIKGTSGNTITEDNLDETVNDFRVVWDIEGFKTENDTEGQYCDSYGSFSTNGEGKVATSFDLRNVPMNFYGRMTASVTYNGKTTVAEKYVVALGNKDIPANQVLPLAGYPVDFSNYPDALVGYSATSETYGTGKDPILSEWCLAGSDGGKSAILQKDNDGTKFVRVTAATSKKSHVLTKTIASPTGQLIFSGKLRFVSAGGVVTLTSGYPFWSASKYTCPVSLSFDGTKLALNGTTLKAGEADAAISKNVWYQVVLSADKTCEKCYALVYDASGKLVAESGLVSWAETSNPTYISIGMGNSNTGSIDIAASQAFTPVADADSYVLEADKTTLSIPNGDTAVLNARLADANGYDITQRATWSIVEEDMQTGVIVTPDENDTHVATVTLGSEAEAGTATVQVSIGGYTKTLELNITSSAESIKFTESSTSVSIPLDADETATATFAASVVDGNGTPTSSVVTLAAYNKEGTTAYTFGEGIDFNPETGILTVTSAASPAVFTIKATALNSDGEPLSKSVRVNVHGLKFDFGYTTDEALAEGYTAVGATTGYTAATGYGIVSGTATEGGTPSDSDAGTDYLEGAIQFDVKVQKGNFYTVEITYQGTLTTGYVNSDLAGYTLGTHSEMATETYTIPATLDIIDLRVADSETSVARIAQVSITKQAKRSKRAKRVVHHIGDSTSANNGSWAYRLKNMIGSDFPELAELCDFHNDGAGGRNLSTYYTQGKLASVLRDIYPEDVVMFGNNGTNGMGSSFEADVNYYLDAVETLGAKVIINSYTPHGCVGNYTGGYDSSTHTFDSYRKDSYETVVRKVAAERQDNDANYLGFVEIGKNADAIFNAYVADYAANGYASADEAAQAIIACFADHNHYNNGTLACNLMLSGYSATDTKGIVAQMVDILSGKVDLTARQDPLHASDYYATFYSSRSAYVLPQGTTAYTGVVDPQASTLTLKPIASGVVPASTAVVLKGDAASITLVPSSGDDTFDGTNDLKGTDVKMSTASAGSHVYVLGVAEGVVGFYRYTASTLGAHKAYLSLGEAAGAKGLSIVFDDVASIGGVAAASGAKGALANGEVYDVSGRKVVGVARRPASELQLKKGLYIVGGKKMVVR